MRPRVGAISFLCLFLTGRPGSLILAWPQGSAGRLERLDAHYQKAAESDLGWVDITQSGKKVFQEVDTGWCSGQSMDWAQLPEFHTQRLS